MNPKIVLYLLLHSDFRNTNAIKIENLEVLYYTYSSEISDTFEVRNKREMVY